MPSEQQLEAVSGNAIPTYSVDWRFMLPAGLSQHMLVVGNGQSDYENSLGKLGIRTMVVTADGLHALADSDMRFTSVAAPIGFERDALRAGRTGWLDDCRAARRLIQSGGSLLIGFPNRWYARSRKWTGRTSSVREMRKTLSTLGFRSIRFFGVLPEPLAPEFIFPLQSHLLGFVLDQRYRYKLPKLALFLAQTFLARFLLNFLPFYYVVASLEERP